MNYVFFRKNNPEYHCFQSIYFGRFYYGFLNTLSLFLRLHSQLGSLRRYASAHDESWFALTNVVIIYPC